MTGLDERVRSTEYAEQASSLAISFACLGCEQFNCPNSYLLVLDIIIIENLFYPDSSLRLVWLFSPYFGKTIGRLVPDKRHIESKLNTLGTPEHSKLSIGQKLIFLYAEYNPWREVEYPNDTQQCLCWHGDHRWSLKPVIKISSSHTDLVNALRYSPWIRLDIWVLYSFGVIWFISCKLEVCHWGEVN